MVISTLFNTKSAVTVTANTPKCRTDTLMRLPNEVILCILENLCIPDLMIVTLLPNKRIRTLAKKGLMKTWLASNSCLLRLCFDQESHWRYTIDFKLTETTDTRFTFTPVKKVSVPLYNSKLLRRPLLYKAALVGPDFVHESDYLLHNLIKSPISIDVKEIGPHHHIYQQQQVSFTYQTAKTPENMVKARPGERWVEPIAFECSFDFLCQTKKLIQRVFDTLHSKPTRRQIDDKSFTASARSPARSNSVAEIGGLYSQKYHYLTPAEKLARAAELRPFIGGLTASTMDTPFAH